MNPHKLADTGIEEIDREHRELLRLIQVVRGAAQMGNAAGSQREVVRTALSRVLAFSRHHFAEEEQLMHKIDFPDFLAHKKEHQTFIDRILSLQREKFAPSSDSLSALENWLLYHVEGSDSRIVSRLLELDLPAGDISVADLFK